ncbi:MAG TPA: DsbA family protein [Micavibrio sp.]
MASLTWHLTTSKFALFAMGFAALCLSAPAHAADTIPEAERTKIESVLKDYLAKNPGIIVESLQKYQDQQRADMDRQFTEKFATIREDILKQGHPTVGAKDADVTIIEFYDYNCGYCKMAFSDVDRVLKEDKKVRFVFIEMPILSESSIEAAKWALAADKQGKFYEYHTALMEFKGQKDKALLKKIAGDIKLDVKKAEVDAESRATLETIEKNMTLARELGINGTPGFIIQDQLTPGYMGYEGMVAAIADTRKAN